MFDDRYEVFLADTVQAKNIHYQLRYQVYHVETGWESHKDVARKRLERDRYDSFSKHFLVRDRMTHEWVGGMRLVVAPFDRLPLSRVCELDDAAVNFDRSRCAEVSRLFVLPDFRCGRRNGNDGSLRVKHRSIVVYNEIVLGLIRAARMYGLNNGLKSWYFLVEPSLARGIQRMGIDLHGFGAEVECHGVRRSYYGEVSTCFERLFSAPTEIREMFFQAEAYRQFSRSALLPHHFDRIASSFVESRRSGLCVRA